MYTVSTHAWMLLEMPASDHTSLSSGAATDILKCNSSVHKCAYLLLLYKDVITSPEIAANLLCQNEIINKGWLCTRNIRYTSLAIASIQLRCAGVASLCSCSSICLISVFACLFCCTLAELQILACRSPHMQYETACFPSCAA